MDKNYVEMATEHAPTAATAKITAMLLLTLAAIAIAFFKGFRLPNSWSTNYFQLSVFDGIFRRSFLGTILSPLGCARFSYWVTASIQLTVFSASIVALVWQAMRAQLGVFLALFFVSAAGGFMFNVLGYPEFFMYLMTLAGIGLVIKRQYVSASIIGALLILTHELAVFTMLPILALSCLLAERELKVKPLATLFLPAATLFAVQLSWFQTSSTATLAHWVSERAACGYPLVRADFLDVLTNSYRARLDLYFSPSQIKFILPPLGILAAVAAHQISEPFKQRSIYAIAIGATCLSPLLLGLAAWDTNRWLLMAFANSLIVLILAARTSRAGAPRIAGSMPLLAAFLLVTATLQLDYFELQPRNLDDAGLQTLRVYLHEDIRHQPTK